MSVISAIGSTAVSGLVKATGVAAIGASVYDAHVLAKLKADQYSQQKEADRVCDAFQNTLYLEQPSTVMSAVKKKIFDFQLENNFFVPINSLLGYLKGFGSMLLYNVVPLALGGLALFGKGKVIPRASALGIALYGAYQVLREGFGLGRANRLAPPYKS